jgi:hypothetical protein
VLTRTGTEPYSTEEVPLSATPIAGSRRRTASSGNGSNARVATVVSASVRKTVATTPIRAPMKGRRFAYGAAREDETQGEADGGEARALFRQQEWQEGKKGHPRGAVD